jgi:hypothetical protein
MYLCDGRTLHQFLGLCFACALLGGWFACWSPTHILHDQRSPAGTYIDRIGTWLIKYLLPQALDQPFLWTRYMYAR